MWIFDRTTIRIMLKENLNNLYKNWTVFSEQFNSFFNYILTITNITQTQT